MDQWGQKLNIEALVPAIEREVGFELPGKDFCGEKAFVVRLSERLLKVLGVLNSKYDFKTLRFAFETSQQITVLHLYSTISKGQIILLFDTKSPTPDITPLFPPYAAFALGRK